MWYRQGEGGSPQYKDQLVFDPVTKSQAGDYVCVAENSVGRSREAVTNVEVLCEYQDLSNASIIVMSLLFQLAQKTLSQVLSLLQQSAFTTGVQFSVIMRMMFSFSRYF